MPYRKRAMLLFMSPWSNHTWVRSFIISTRTNTLMFVGSCLACRLHLFVIHSNPAWQRPLNYFRFFFGSTTSYWTYFRLKTATHEILINDKFPTEPTVLASQNEMWLVGSRTWTSQYLIRIYKVNCSYNQWT